MRIKRLKMATVATAALALASCASVSYKTVGFDVLRPAEYTLPSWTDTLILVDNVAKPVCTDSSLPADYKSYGQDFNRFGHTMADCAFRSMLYEFKKSGYMGIRLLGNPLKLNAYRIDSLLIGHPGSVILSLDKMESKSVMRFAGEQENMDGQIETCVDIVTDMHTRMSLITSPQSRVELTERTDTLRFQSCGTTNYDIARGFPQVMTRYQRQGNHLGYLYVDALLPTWERVYRSFFVTNNKDMSAAAEWVEKNDWEEAKNLWFRAYEESGKAGKTAESVRAAINMAVANEREDNPVEASLWCSRALDAIDAADAKTQEKLVTEKKRAESMFAYLMIRIEEKKDLDKQMN